MLKNSHGCLQDRDGPYSPQSDGCGSLEAVMNQVSFWNALQEQGSLTPQDTGLMSSTLETLSSIISDTIFEGP